MTYAHVVIADMTSDMTSKVMHYYYVQMFEGFVMWLIWRTVTVIQCVASNDRLDLLLMFVSLH